MGPGFESLIVHQKTLISHRNGLFSCLFCPIFVSFVHFYPLFGGYFLLFSPCWGTNWGTDWGINWSVNWSVNWGINWGIKSPTFIFSILSINKNIPTSLLPEVNIHPTNRYTCHLIYFCYVLQNNPLPLLPHRTLHISYKTLYANHNKYD